MNNKGAFRTMEVIMAAVIGIIVLLSVLPKQVKTDNTVRISSYLIYNDEFRQLVIKNDTTGLKNFLDTQIAILYPEFNFDISVSKDPNYILTFNQTTDIYSKSFLIAGNITNVKDYIVRIYYWKK